MYLETRDLLPWPMCKCLSRLFRDPFFLQSPLTTPQASDFFPEEASNPLLFLPGKTRMAGKKVRKKIAAPCSRSPWFKAFLSTGPSGKCKRLVHDFGRVCCCLFCSKASTDSLDVFQGFRKKKTTVRNLKNQILGHKLLKALSRHWDPGSPEKNTQKIMDQTYESYSY